MSPEDHVLVTAAVAEAEATTDGEIVTIVAPASDDYRDIPWFYAIAAMLLVPAALAFIPQGIVDRAEALLLGWNAEAGRAALMGFIFVKQIIVAAIVWLIVSLPAPRMALTPGGVKDARVRRRAMNLFKVAAERRTHGRTGVLLYLSLAEHRAEIVADQAIHEKVEPEIWGEAMAAMIDDVRAGRPGEGMARAVQRIGEICSNCFPKSDADYNQLPDRLIEL
ncbi:MAG: TPM domain-containing protein [Sphingomonadaceae bacterium]